MQSSTQRQDPPSPTLRVVVPNLSFPSRPCGYSPWAVPSASLPTVCTRYDVPLVYSNASTAAGAHQLQPPVNVAGSSFHTQSDTAKWIGYFLSRQASRLRLNLKRAKLNLYNLRHR
ncbi:hypothetical protein HYPSUDRAFT_204857 [Hypholoma sublateritium FD-334 SS-4]|uniref:Uncharacterized protein n=1 Tax=Hypholoma sublateritium (strain FD-334 SS-4) TaxID=945553 RepID=A0A0D2KX12_HYPSF|nr:hypothetical protein HYPSUDRAFT_204857 [Hypholoma sublateritium FD-334 SS-4]